MKAMEENMTAVKATAERELKVLKNMSFQKVVVKKEGIENRFEREKFRETKLRDTKEKLRKRLENNWFSENLSDVPGFVWDFAWKLSVFQPLLFFIDQGSS